MAAFDDDPGLPSAVATRSPASSRAVSGDAHERGLGARGGQPSSKVGPARTAERFGSAIAAGERPWLISQRDAGRQEGCPSHRWLTTRLTGGQAGQQQRLGEDRDLQIRDRLRLVLGYAFDPADPQRP